MFEISVMNHVLYAYEHEVDKRRGHF